MTLLRVAVHVHSSWSYDAGWPIADVARALRRRRYDAVLMAEHDRGFTQKRWADYQAACAECSNDGILVIPGIEYEDADGVVHLPVWGIDMPFLGERREPLDTLRITRECGGVAVFAHPWRRDAASRYVAQWTPLLSGVEIWNRKYDGVAPRPEARLLAERDGLSPFVSLDFHTSRQFFPLAMEVNTAELSAAAVVEAIGERRCQPRLGRFPALRFAAGPEGASLRAFEGVRRSLRGPLRRLPQRVGP